jgi:predicted AlkP superfamily pyrophosphatase or phosphodiesterase
MHKTVVINAVGLSRNLLGAHTPRLNAFAGAGKTAQVGAVLPAVTCSVQATYLTGTWPSEHGIVGNGWYFRDDGEIRFWRQSNRLVQRPKVWEIAKQIDAKFTCANLFWWFNMYSSADVAVTPRPMYPADGRKLPDIWTQPGDLRRELQDRLGQFPLFQFWGPTASIRSTQWIADSAVCVDERFDPTLTLIYLPHLDYCLQRVGPVQEKIGEDLRDLDRACGQLIDHYNSRGARIIILSEYGITPVSRPVHINRLLREHGLITVREELERELLDAGASAAFAVPDHQVAHVYVNDATRVSEVRRLLEGLDGVAQVLDRDAQRQAHLDHPRSGELVAVAAPDAWFTYYYWLDDSRAPDFARTVDIHRKPGYDPAELFIDPRLRAPKLRVAWRLAQKTLGFRYLMDVIGLDASLVRGSHGRQAGLAEEGPLLMTQQTNLLREDVVPPTDVCQLILRHLGIAD